ncbi:MAG: AAA family ATPase [Verrucomicrobia bacterium]|nr:AAA family ATPase [Verrucomicrobiota bacterium]
MKPKAKLKTKAKAKATKPKELSLLTQPLGLEGWANLEPVVLAALASEDPLLLIGRHGSAKSFLLERLAKALELEYRFYNASLINYDDLVGIPVPAEDQRSLRYISTETAIWDAEVVFIDEINRSRPELQNKLFPIIHEKRVQGVALERLRYRWAAMNPPPNPDDLDADQEFYLGAEPLDPALADRFAFLIATPAWQDLTDRQKGDILSDQFRGEHAFPVPPDELVSEIRQLFNSLQKAPSPTLHEYLIGLERLLGNGNFYISARRVSILHRNILAIQAARVALQNRTGAEADWNTSALLALRHGIPQLAQAGALDQSVLLAAHRQAWELAELEKNDPWRELLQVGNPWERFILSVQFGDRLSDMDVGRLILDGVASQPTEAHRTAASLLAYLAVHQNRNIPGTVVETLSRDIQRILKPRDDETTIFSGRAGAARVVGQLCASLPMARNNIDKQRVAYTQNLLNGLLPDGYSGTTPAEIERFFTANWRRLALPRICRTTANR